ARRPHTSRGGRMASQVELVSCIPVVIRPSSRIVAGIWELIESTSSGVSSMRGTSSFRSSLIVLLTLIGVTLESAAYADSGGIAFRVFKGGFVIGGSAGSGTLYFHGRRYPLG